MRTGLPVSFSTSSEYLLVFTKLLYLWEAGIGQVIKNGDALAGEMIQLLKPLLDKLGDLSIIPRTRVVVCDCTQREGARARRIPGVPWLSSPPYSMSSRQSVLEE